MKKIFIYIAFIYISSINILNAQTYYGTNKLGKLKIINDSLYSVSFYALNEWTYIDTGTYKRNDDTIWLNSIVKRPFEIVDRSTEYSPAWNCNRYLIKQYGNYQNKYRLVYEYTAPHIYVDTIRNQLICSWVPSNESDIFVIYDGFIYRRVRKTGKSTQFFRIRIFDDKMERVYFDEFPLLVKGNKLIPIDKEKNEQCWVDNGFYFPKMKRSNKEKEFNKILILYRGLRGLPSGFEIK